MVKSNKVYSPQNYLEKVTGNCYLMKNSGNDIEFIKNMLNHNGFTLLSNHPLSDIKYIVENGLNVVLVDCLIWDYMTNEFKHIYQWFEVPENFEKN